MLILRRDVPKGYAPAKKYCGRLFWPFVYRNFDESLSEASVAGGSVAVRSERDWAMSSGGNHRPRPLALVSGAATSPEAGNRDAVGATDAQARALDWSILMAHAQAGEQDAYRRLLHRITPYIRSMAAKCHRNSSDIEDSVQDVLLTVHAIRHTYDPTRPFGPWLVAIANRRIVDRLRHHGRSVARETPFTAEHETFPEHGANYRESMSDTHALQQAIERLPHGQREAIRLLKLQELSLKEAATASGMSVAALKVATHRAMKSLRRIFVNPAEDK